MNLDHVEPLPLERRPVPLKPWQTNALAPIVIEARIGSASEVVAVARPTGATWLITFNDSDLAQTVKRLLVGLVPCQGGECPICKGGQDGQEAEALPDP
jgi:hypothetical protein